MERPKNNQKKIKRSFHTERWKDLIKKNSVVQGLMTSFDLVVLLNFYPPQTIGLVEMSIPVEVIHDLYILTISCLQYFSTKPYFFFQEISPDSLATVISVSRYNSTNFCSFEDLCKEYELENGVGKSIPQVVRPIPLKTINIMHTFFGRETR